jgi:hypothetical protein
LKSAGALLATALGFLAAGCSSLAVPTLRHETAETLGSGRIRLRGHLESARLFPNIGATAADGFSQDDSVFRGWIFGVQGAAGLTNRLDAQLGMTYMLGGSGWRLGSKYAAYALKRFKFAVMAGYGRYSSKGTTEFKTTGQPFEVSLTQSAWVVDFGVPVSYRLSPAVALYTGMTFYRSGLSGSANNNAVATMNSDLGVNLGMQLHIGAQFEGDVEMSLMRLYDPFTDSIRYIPFWGISGGIVF